ncbi:hypothetical protein VQ03_01060 [Methylobacterium tarhaniae]|uniref:DNA topoisomerase IV subunit B n=2 Tax=Methylobacterium tarhaniae TaxID=1187852 RepID=A0A0J6TFX4_9HYPH|nr:DUF2783 domain-containing protein [Methylobacterium tarhaniae]KMO44837.1 hypothetical protein VQ03_01060 [Methylobacterium tarhaniae]
MTASLRQGDGFAGRADAVYETLIRAHQTLSDEESAALNARLVLILANEVGDPAVLEQAIALARRSLRPADPDHARP